MRRVRLALIAAVPAAILIAGQCASFRYAARPAGGARARLDARAAEVERRLDALLESARAAARSSLDHGPESAAEALRAPLDQRLEGAGVVRGGRLERWTGTPEEPSLFGEPGSAHIVARGIRTSLLVSTPRDDAGQTGIASFVWEIAASALKASRLLPGDDSGIAARWELAAGATTPAERFDPGPPATLSRPWVANGKTPLGLLVLEESGAAALSARARATAQAWAGLALALLVAAGLARRPAPVDRPRVVQLAAGIVIARAALVLGRSFEVLLPRSLGSPSLYGRGDGFGLFASPAALFVTALCAAVLLTAVARYAADVVARGGRPARLAARGALWGLTGAGAAALVALGASLTRDARVLVPRLDLTSPGTTLLAIAAACWIAGVAEVAAAAVGTLGASKRSSPRAGRLAVAAAMIPLSLLLLAQLYRTSDQVIDERLRSEFAPLVLEQSARRRVALTAAVGDCAANPRVAAALEALPETDDPYLAYGLWMDSDLFREGFASSLDLYDAEGTLRGHFGFGFPQVGGNREAAARAQAPGGPLTVELETVPVGASLLRVVHIEAAVAGPRGELAGWIAGHVLEDPGNLPFLPESAPYIEALGGGSRAADTPTTESPDYVRFDDEGRVVSSTVRQSPAATAELRAAGAAKRRVEILAGDTLYRALPLADGQGGLHLLLMPAPTLLGVLADAVRLLLLGLAVVAIAALGSTASEHGRGRAILDIVRASFYRKVLAAVLVASVVPLVAISVFLRTYIDRRGEASLADSAAAVVGAARRVVEDYQTVGEDDPTIPRLRINDEALWWLRRVVGQEIHVYEGGVLAATSKPELFDSALLAKRLPGEVDRDLVREGRPFVVRRERLGTLPLPVAYARIDERGGPEDAVIAVPLVIEQRAYSRSVDRLVQMLLLLTTALVVLLAASAAWIARSVALPVRRLAEASRRIAGGDYGTRLASTSRDEVGSLVNDFNRMSGALAGQRADLERRRDYIEALLRFATTGVISIDAAGRVVTINPAASGLLERHGASPRHGELLVATLRTNGAAAPLASALEAPIPAGGTPSEIDLESGEETLRLRLVRVALPDPFGGASGTLILLDDVTSLMRSNQLAAWAEMARAIAHEIKNPLTPIQLSTEHVRKLLNDRGILPVPEIDACLDTIVRNVRELRDISGAFSAYAKIPDLALVPVDPESFMRELAAPYRAAPPQKVMIDERHDGAARMLADPRVLARAVVNLVENALQAMPAGGTLTLASYRGDAGEVVLEVSDTGHGLTPDARARLFEPYFSTKSSGTGLGLAIARRVVLGHGGTIDVTSAPGRGTTFRIRLKEAPRG